MLSEGLIPEVEGMDTALLESDEYIEKLTIYRKADVDD